MKKGNAIFLLSLIGCGLLVSPVFAATADELKQAIEEKAKGLNEINSKILTIQKQLETAQDQKRSLKQELNKINYNINQLNLGIKASEINIEKLGLELQSTQLDIGQISDSISTKKNAVVNLVRELYQKDHESLITVFLKNKSLADSVLENQSIANLNNGLSSELEDLKVLNNQLNDKLKITTDKKKAIELENGNLKNRRAIISDQKSERQNLLAQTQDQEKIYQQQISELEKKQLEISDQIDAIETELRKSFNVSLLPTKRPGMLSWPLENLYITQHYGEIALYRGRTLYHGKPHNGTDFGASIGTPIFAAADGTVTAVGNNGRIEYGKYVLIHHDNNLATLYAHLSNNKIVQGGEVVKKGQVIGYSGNTGYVIGRGHLHLGLYWDDQSLGRGVQLENLPGCNCGLVPIGITINPEDYLPSR